MLHISVFKTFHRLWSLFLKYSSDIIISLNRKSPRKIKILLSTSVYSYICLTSVLSYNFSLLYTTALRFPVFSQNNTPQGTQVCDLILQVICWKYQVVTPQLECQRIRVLGGIDFRAKQEKAHVPAQVVGRKDMD